MKRALRETDRFHYPASVRIFGDGSGRVAKVAVDAGAGKGVREFQIDPSDRGSLAARVNQLNRVIEMLSLAFAEATGTSRGQVVAQQEALQRQAAAAAVDPQPRPCVLCEKDAGRDDRFEYSGLPDIVIKPVCGNCLSVLYGKYG
tara:strand:- start:378 stop:812 length:435 start_codon:yes stop_codon:yes gene_type:complete